MTEYIQIWRGLGILKTRIVRIATLNGPEARFLAWQPHRSNKIAKITWEAHTESLEKNPDKVMA